MGVKDLKSLNVKKLKSVHDSSMNIVGHINDIITATGMSASEALTTALRFYSGGLLDYDTRVQKGSESVVERSFKAPWENYKDLQNAEEWDSLLKHMNTYPNIPSIPGNNTNPFPKNVPQRGQIQNPLYKPGQDRMMGGPYMGGAKMNKF